MKFISRSICAASVCAVLAGLCTSAQAWDKWDAFKAANVNDSFRVVDYSDNRRITTSEGQSYAMFFALVAGDKDSFEKLLKWTENNLASGDITKYKPSWLWGKHGNSWGIIDSNNAADSDMWIAYCLLEAGRLWDRPDYTAKGKAMMDLLMKDVRDVKGLGKVKYILKKGGTLGDLYTSSDLMYDEKGYIKVDDSGQVILTDDGENAYLGSVFPDYNLAWRNDFSWKGIHLGILFSGRIGGICYSATQANLDYYGVSKVSADARDAGGVLVNGRQMVDAQKWYQTIGANSGLPQYYTYDATNFRLQELSIGYTLTSKWFKNVCSLTISAVGHNLWMIWCKAPFDPESIATTGNNYQGIDYFMMPSLRSMGFNIKLDF